MGELKVSRKRKKKNTIIDVNGVKIGGKNIVFIAGPCAISGKEEIIGIAKALKEKGADMLRGGAFKPRTNPYSFQGMGEEGLKCLKAARDETGLPIVTEVMDTKDVELVAKYADILQVGTRNMQNFSLLKEVGKAGKPVLLKRGMSATLDEFINAAEYIAAEGNNDVILCERGIRTFNTYTRNTLDLSLVPALKEKTHLPVVVDPSHGTGVRSFVVPMGKAAVASGCDGLMIEAHVDPEKSISDKDQTIDIDEFGRLVEEVRKVAKSVGRG